MTDAFVLSGVRTAFAFPDRPTVGAFAGVVTKHSKDGWSIAYYRASHQRIWATRSTRCTPTASRSQTRSPLT
jgi:hypothetical protein